MSKPIEFQQSNLNLDWNNEDLFFTYSWTDETSQFDDHYSKRWNGNYYTREYKCRIPIAFRNSEVIIDKFICFMEDYPEEEGFWV